MTVTDADTQTTGTAPSAQQRFVDAALELFVEHGFNGTSLQMIGDRLGVSKAAVAYHFRSKDDLLAAVLEGAFADLGAVLDEAEAVRRESARRSQALDGYIDYLIRHRRVSTWLSRDVAALTHPAVLGPIQELTARIDAILMGDADPLARVWASAITQALSGPIVAGVDLGDDELRDELHHLGRHMLRGYQSARRRAAVRG